MERERLSGEWQETARQLRQLLGPNAHLLDEYLRLLFQGMLQFPLPAISAEAADTGLQKLCWDILSGEESEGCCSTPCYDLVKDYISSVPLPYKCQDTKLAVYCILLSDVWLQKSLERYEAFMTEQFHAVIGESALIELWQQIHNAAGSGDGLLHLSDLIAERYRTVQPVDAYVQSMGRSVLQHLLHRDAESGKYVYQLLDRMLE